MVNHYRRVLEAGLKYKVAINAHEPIKATGIRRTYPNAVSREGLRGQEFNAWSSEGGNSIEHLTEVAFTRMLAGPIDYTPGIFNLKMDPYKPDNQVKHTLAHELALYVVIYSPIQMVADLPEHMENQPGMQFIRDVGVDWEETQALDGEVGDFVIIARKERDSENWFVGGITDENSREVVISLDFLENQDYTAKIYRDGPNAHWNENPTELEIEEKLVTADTRLTLSLAEGGGFAISLIPVE
jgi:alpha-glucosidase